MKATYLLILSALFSAAAFAQNTYSPKNESMKQLNHLKSALERKYEGRMAEPQAIVGDINGDKLPDCILSYVFTPKEGGNMIVGHVSTVFINTGKGMRKGVNFPELKFCYTPKSISNGVIIVSKYTCAPPYNDDQGTAKLAYRNGKVVEVK